MAQSVSVSARCSSMGLTVQMVGGRGVFIPKTVATGCRCVQHLGQNSASGVHLNWQYLLTHLGGQVLLKLEWYPEARVAFEHVGVLFWPLFFMNTSWVG